MTRSKTLELAMFGGSDGLIACAGIVLATAGRGAGAVLAAAIGLLIAEGLGMAVSQWLSDEAMSLRDAAVMGVSTSTPIAIVAAPWVLLTGWPALAASGVLALALAAMIAQERQGGVTGWLQTYGVLIAVAGLAWAAARL